MAMRMDNGAQDFFNRLQVKIEKAQSENKPFEHYVKKQIELLKGSHDEFVSRAKEEGYDLNNPRVGEIEVQQYSAMKALASKYGLPVDEYDEMIKNVQIRIFGEENYENFFGKNS